ncbi:Holliday junction branch migration protein RuvA [bacterium]|nr:Holliday junction branch migration protein RuvA [bacterium]
MISWIKGKIIDIDGNNITVNTGNIGYQVFIGDNVQLQLGIKKGAEVELVIYTSVREDEIKLFGFSSFFVRRVFALLLTVNGIGPKAASSIVDQIDAVTIVSSIRSGNFSPFLSVSGIGKKSAQRIILDLQGKLDRFEIPEMMGTEENSSEILQKDPFNQMKVIEDGKSALTNLGFSEKEADRVVRHHFTPGINLGEIIRKSLADLQQ